MTDVGLEFSDLSPAWLGRIEESHDGRFSWYHDVPREAAQGVMFQCPKCKEAYGHTHMVICWDPDVPTDLTPKPGRWDMRGDVFESLSLVGRGTSSSVLLLGGCGAHFFVTDGMVKAA